jgi:hypothetical protein
MMPELSKKIRFGGECLFSWPVSEEDLSGVATAKAPLACATS